MNEQRPLVMVLLAALLGAGGLYFGVTKLITEPLATKQAERKKAEGLADAALDSLNEVRLQVSELDEVARRCLPGDRRLAVEEYQAFLLGLTKSADIPNPTVNSDSPRPVGKGGGMFVLPFTITAETDIWSVVKLLHHFYLAPRVHQVLDLSLTPVERKDIGPALRVSLSIEAIALGDSKKDPLAAEVPFDPPVDADREAYSSLVEKNILFATGPGSGGLRSNDPEHVVLTFIVQQGESLEADLFDRAQNAARRVHVGEELTIGRVRAVVVDMGLRDMVLRIDGNLYLWQNGSTFSSRTLLSAEEALDREVRNRKRLHNMN